MYILLQSNLFLHWIFENKQSVEDMFIKSKI